MREFVLAFLCGALIAITVRAETGPTDRFSIRKHRYSPHGEAGYERFVLEFDGSRRKDPGVQVSGSGGTWTVRVGNARLDGAIPESVINERTLRGAHVFKSVAIDADGSGKGFSLRFQTKKSDANVKAFWLESPARLVVDAYASGIPAANESGGTRVVAGRGKKTPEFFCFSAEAQVGLSTVFQRKIRGEATPEATPPTATSGDPIVCYPASAQVVARVMLERQKGMTTTSAPVEAAPVAEVPAYVPPPAEEPAPKVTAEDGKRYWIAPYLPGGNTPPVAPMEPPKAVSATPVTEGLKDETAVAQQSNAPKAQPQDASRRTSSLETGQVSDEPNDGSFGPMK